MDNNQMNRDVAQAFAELQEKYPRTEGHLQKCLNEIQGGNKAATREEKKGKMKKLLSKSMDMTHLDLSYKGLVDVKAKNEHELIELLKKLSNAILCYKKKMTLFPSRQGKLMKDAKIFLKRQVCNHVCVMCGFSPRYCNFLISFYDLLEVYPRLCYCAVPIRTFMSNMKMIRQICEEESIFWKNIA